MARTVAEREALNRRSYLLLYLLSKVGIINHDELSELVYAISSKLEKEDLPFEYEFQHEDGILFSQDLNEDLTRLTRMKFIETHVKVLDDVFNICVHEYKLTKYGEEIARRIGEELGEKRKDFDRLIKECRKELGKGISL